MITSFNYKKPSHFSTSAFLMWLLLLFSFGSRGNEKSKKLIPLEYDTFCNRAPDFDLANRPPGMNLVFARHWQTYVPDICQAEFEQQPPDSNFTVRNITKLCNDAYQSLFNHLSSTHASVEKLRAESFKVQDWYVRLFEEHFKTTIQRLTSSPRNTKLFLELYEQIKQRNNAYLTALIAKKHNIGNCQEAADTVLVHLLELQKRADIPKKIQILTIKGSTRGLVSDHVALVLDSNIPDGKYSASSFFNISAREAKGHLCDTWQHKPRIRPMQRVLSLRKHAGLKQTTVSLETVSFLNFPKHVSTELKKFLRSIDLISNPDFIFEVARPAPAFLHMLGLERIMS